MKVESIMAETELYSEILNLQKMILSYLIKTQLSSSAIVYINKKEKFSAVSESQNNRKPYKLELI